MYPRQIKLKNLNSSAFLFGPRLTGKTTLLRTLKYKEYFDLLDPALELEYKSKPELFWQQLSALPEKSTVIIDEIQKIPILLNYVQMAIEKYRFNFILSGSSARKLRRGGVNLLGGRALELKLHPLTCDEIGDDFSVNHALEYGTIPKIYTLLKSNNKKLARDHLKSYISTYLKQEIQAEALTRNIGAFNRFLNVAAQCNGQVIEFANISRECSVPSSTVKEYYQILEDTLIGFFLWPFNRSERKKARPKFYFFDCGVVRAIQNRLNDPPTPSELGYLFETWLLNELIRIRDYNDRDHQFSFWRNRDQEIDIIISDGRGPVLAIECKSSKAEINNSVLNNFRNTFKSTELITASFTDTKPRKTVSGLDILPWKSAINNYKRMCGQH